MPADADGRHDVGATSSIASATRGGFVMGTVGFDPRQRLDHVGIVVDDLAPGAR